MLSTDALATLVDDDGDIDISAGRRQFVSGLAGVVALVRARLALYRGEWFMRRSAGVPYAEGPYVTEREAILGSVFDEGKARAAFSSAILGTPGIVELASLVVTFVPESRRLLVAWEARTEFGDRARGTVGV